MTVWEVVLVFVGIPVGVFLLMAAAVYGAGTRRSRRYRPGRPFEFAPVWFLASPERVLTADDAVEPAEPGTAMLPAGGSGSNAASGSSGSNAASGSSGAIAASAGSTPAVAGSSGSAHGGSAHGGSAHGVKGGASGSW